VKTQKSEKPAKRVKGDSKVLKKSISLKTINEKCLKII